MNIGKIIRIKRKQLGYTQQILANKLNISFQAVSKWETLQINEKIIECNSGGVTHLHCMDTIICRRKM